MKPEDIEKESLLKEDRDPEIEDSDSLLLYSSGRWRWFHTNRCVSRCITLLLPTLFFTTIGILTVIAVLTQQKLVDSDSAAPNPGIDGCGETPAEAEAAGCIFDLMNYGWTPPACYDRELSTLSLDSGPWKWYYDHNATQPIDQDVIQRGQEMHVWTEHHFHMAHCLYAFKVIHKATITAQLVPKELIGWNHTKHCDELLLGKTDLDVKKITTKVRMIFNPCARLGDEGMD